MKKIISSLLVAFVLVAGAGKVVLPGQDRNDKKMVIMYSGGKENFGDPSPVE